MQYMYSSIKLSVVWRNLRLTKRRSKNEAAEKAEAKADA